MSRRPSSETFRQVPDWLIRRDGVQLSSAELDLVLVLASFQGARESAFPAVSQVAAIVGLGERQTRRLLNALVDRGYVTRTRPRRRGTYEYDVRPLLSGAVRSRPSGERDAERTPTSGRRAPERTPTSAPERTPTSGLERTPTSGPKEKQFKDKQGKDTAREARPPAAAAEEVLRHYRERTGQPVRARRASGAPSHDLRLVAQAMKDHPNLSVGDWRDVVDRNLAAPWWRDAPSVGAIFAPSVVARAIANDGRTRRKPWSGALDDIFGRAPVVDGEVVAEVLDGPSRPWRETKAERGARDLAALRGLLGDGGGASDGVGAREVVR